MFLVSFIFVFYSILFHIHCSVSIIGYFVSHVLLFSFNSIYINIESFCVLHTVLTVAYTSFIRDIHDYIFKYLFDNQFQVLFIKLINRLE